MAHSYAPHDFNHDLYSDILWRNDNGAVALWTIRDNQAVDAKALETVPASEHIVSTGDLSGDLTSDIVWRNTSNGNIHAWFISNEAIQSKADILNPGLQWAAIDRGLSYYNADQYQDILFQNVDGRIYLWDMNGSTIIDSGPVGGNPGPTWHPRLVGDYNGDGKADVFWQNDNGQLSIWLLNNKEQPIATVDLGNPGTAWHPVGSGDFNADGHSDVFWRNNDGTVAVWFMNGTTVTQAVSLGNPGTQWVPVSVGYYNNDDYSDILWRNSQTGDVGIWDMQGSQATGVGVASAIPLDWHIVI